MNVPGVPALGWRARWLDRRDHWLGSAGFREWASRFWLTRPLARRRARELFDLVAGFAYSQWLAVCVELKLFDRLARSPMAAEQLAADAVMPLHAAQRLLQAATALRLVEPRGEDAVGRALHGLGPLGAAMVDNPALAALVSHHRALYADLAEPMALLRRGGGGGEVASYWAYAKAARPGALDETRTAPYSALMAASQPLVAGQVLTAYPLHRHQVLMDVGGGEGVFAAEALRRHPHLQVLVFDLPAVAAEAGTRLQRLGFSNRARAVGGDFMRDALPLGADVVSLVRVLYDHDDAPALAILEAVRAALPRGGTLLVAEPMADTAGAEAMGAAYFGFYLLAMGSGRSRSATELGGLLKRAGFGHVRRLPTALPLQAGALVARAV